jgi:hypothetical protein
MLFDLCSLIFDLSAHRYGKWVTYLRGAEDAGEEGGLPHTL